MSVEPQLALDTTTDTVRAPRLLAMPGRLLQLLPGREGAFWVLFAAAAPRVLGPVFTIMLRRILGPGAAGIFDLASTPYKFLDNFRNFGTGPALVYEKTVSRAVANTAWSLNMIFAVIVTLAAQLLAGPIAGFFRHPEIEGVFRILSIGYVFASVASVHSFLLLRDLDFRARSIPAVGQVIAAGDVAIIFAVWGFGTGALVAREITSVVLGAILLWAVYPYRPSPQFVPQIAWKLFRYGAWVGAGLTILYMSQNVDTFIGGRIIRKASDIGFYTTSWKLAFIAASIFTLVASSMVFPSLSRVQDNIQALRIMLIKAIRQLGIVMFPAAALLAATAPVLIVPVLGQKFAGYRDSFLVLSLLAIYAGNRTMLSIFFEAYKSIGKPWLVWAYNSVKLVIMIPAMIFGAYHGIVGLATVYIPIQIVEIPAALYLADRILHVTPSQVWHAASVPIIGTLAMGAAVVGTELFLLRVAHAGDLVTLIICLVIAPVIYLGSILALDRTIISEARTVLSRGL
ncbi:MAG: lipopolysaccharide biosynthesis protein [Chloroflexota bacterium]